MKNRTLKDVERRLILLTMQNEAINMKAVEEGQNYKEYIMEVKL